uniref:Uncharacterized protein n=1 Tax=Toxoplasma gondii COUG TaxID=1074873 RepID=A0A2G8YAH3_TOXGO|nr:hypothetical protein TGCOUG_273650 [Toxoplasma gondii COUG]
MQPVEQHSRNPTTLAHTKTDIADPFGCWETSPAVVVASAPVLELLHPFTKRQNRESCYYPIKRANEMKTSGDTKFRWFDGGHKVRAENLNFLARDDLNHPPCLPRQCRGAISCQPRMVGCHGNRRAGEAACCIPSVMQSPSYAGLRKYNIESVCVQAG